MENAAVIEVLRVLRAMRRRLLARRFLSVAARFTLFFYGFLALLHGFAWWRGVLTPDLTAIPLMAAWPFIAGAMGAVFVVLLRVPRLRHVAALVDALGNTRDRFLAVVDFSERKNPTPFTTLSAAESAEWLRGRRLGRLLPVRPPAELRWLVVPVATLALVWADALRDMAARHALVAAARTETQAGLRQLEEIERQFSRAADDPAMQRIAAQLRESAAQVRAEADRGGEAGRALLRELARLEHLAKELRRPEFATENELKALAGALEKHDLTREAAKDLQAGDNAAAAEKLAQAAKDAAAGHVADSLQRALDHLADRKEALSKQMEQLQESGAAGGDGNSGLLQEIADALKSLQQQGKLAEQRGKAADGQPQQGAGKPMTREDLQKLLGALQQMKEQQQGGEGRQGAPGEGEGDEKALVQMFSFAEGGKGSEDGPQFPTGQAGGERDEGTTREPFGKESSPLPEGGASAAERGQLGEGESLSALVPSAGAGDVKAQRRFKELTDAAAAAAEDAVIREEIPLGARHVIRRYFEAIRPK